MQKKIFASLTAAVLVVVSFSGLSQGINTSEWKVLSDDNHPEKLSDTVFMGKACVKLDAKTKSVIWKQTTDLKNFRMDLDIAGAIMSGIGFHVADEQNYQFIYFRPGYGGTEEAVQYIPIYNGALSWVMYGKYQSVANIKFLEWFHAIIEVRGSNLRVFINDSKKPEMNITMLHGSADRGSILLRTLFGETYFANVSFREIPEIIQDWEISEQMPASPLHEYTQVEKVRSWKKINEISDDYVNLSRYFPHPNGTVAAKHIIHSDSEEARWLNFDFAGKLQIFLNGKEVFNYDRYKLDRIEETGNRISLNLKKGDNELVFLTQGDGFLFPGGKGYNSLGRFQHQNWGFIASIFKPPY